MIKQEMYFKDVLELWMKNNMIRLKGGTINKYQSLINTHILPEFGDIKIHSLTSTQINLYLTHKLQSGRLDQMGGLSSSYVKSIMLIINSVMKYAAQEELCPPLKTPIYKPAICKKDCPLLSLEDQHRLEVYLSQNSNPTTIGILISLHTGLRIGEVCALSWENVDMDNGIIHVRHTVARVKDDIESDEKSTKLIIDTPKTKASFRDVPISSALFPFLQEASLNAKSLYVASETDHFINPRTFEYRYHQILKKCGISSINFHALRHTFATRCIEAGVDIKSLSEILGHSNVSITMNTYVHSSMEMKKKQLEKYAKISA